MRTLILLLLITASAAGQFVPFAMWKTAASSSFDPTSIDTLRLWLKADAITGKSSGDTLYRWPASFGSDAFQLTAAKKPIYYADSIGGKPTVYFDGADDWLKSACVMNSGAGTVFAVVRSAKGGTGNDGTVAMSTNEAQTDAYVGGASVYWILDSLRSSHISSYINAWVPSVFFANYTNGVLIQKISGTSATMYLNDFAAKTGTISAAAKGSTVLYVGAQWTNAGPVTAAFLHGHIAELLVYSTALSDVNRAAVQTYLKNKYGTP